MVMITPDMDSQDAPCLNVGLCQVYTEAWAVEENLERTLTALAQARAEGAEFAIVPECVLHGYGPTNADGYRDRMLEIAEPLDGPRLSRICEQAKALSLYVLVGFAERGEGERVHNSAATISPEGEVLSVYRKVHLRPFESLAHQGMFSPGDRFEVTALTVGDRTFQAGTMICFDREIPESVRCLRSLGAELIGCPLATDTSALAILDPKAADNELITRCRAAENEVFIVVVNHAGRFNGGSFAVGPRGEILHQMGAKPGVDVVALPVGLVQKKYHSNPLGWMGWGYRRQAVYDRYLEGGDGTM